MNDKTAISDFKPQVKKAVFKYIPERKSLSFGRSEIVYNQGQFDVVFERMPFEFFNERFNSDVLREEQGEKQFNQSPTPYEALDLLEAIAKAHIQSTVEKVDCIKGKTKVEKTPEDAEKIKQALLEFPHFESPGLSHRYAMTVPIEKGGVIVAFLSIVRRLDWHQHARNTSIEVKVLLTDKGKAAGIEEGKVGAAVYRRRTESEVSPVPEDEMRVHPCSTAQQTAMRRQRQPVAATTARTSSSSSALTLGFNTGKVVPVSTETQGSNAKLYAGIIFGVAVLALLIADGFVDFTGLDMASAFENGSSGKTTEANLFNSYSAEPASSQSSAADSLLIHKGMTLR